MLSALVLCYEIASALKLDSLCKSEHFVSVSKDSRCRIALGILIQRYH